MGSLKEKVGGTIEIQVLEDVMVPMRDGIRLATDCYLPVGMQGRGLHLSLIHI
jgi:predicted acyl esterase